MTDRNRRCIDDLLKGNECKYIRVITRATGFSLQIRIRVKCASAEQKIKWLITTQKISNPINESNVLAALNSARKLREKLYYDHFGTSLESSIIGAQKTGAKYLVRNPTNGDHNQTGYNSVHINVFSKTGKIFFLGFLVKVPLQGGDNTPKTRLFNFGKNRSENDAYLEACKLSDTWHGRPHKQDAEYLKVKKVIDWREKINLRKSSSEKKLTRRVFL